MLYATAADRVVALRGDSGAEIWRFTLEQGAPSQRGLELLARRRGDRRAHLFYGRAHARRARRGDGAESAREFGSAGELPMPTAYNAAPTRFEDLLIVGSNGPPGGVRAYDARSGEERWASAAARRCCIRRSR